MKHKYLNTLIKAMALAIGLPISFVGKGENLINPDRIWHYEPYCSTGDVTFQMQFGKDTVVEEKTYTVFSTTRTVYTTSKDGIKHSEEAGPGSAYLLREEGSKVYLRNPGQEALKGEYPVYGWPYQDQECLLYDFSLKEGEEYDTVDALLRRVRAKIIKCYLWTDAYGEAHKCQTIEFTVMVDGTNGGEQRTEDVAEGVGLFGRIAGTIIGVEITLPTGHPRFKPPYPNPMDFSTLRKITDLEGKTVYTADQLGAVEDILVNSDSSSDGQIFNLMGLPVANPQPGTIYIRNGKKFVMR